MDFSWSPEQDSLHDRLSTFARESLVSDSSDAVLTPDEWRRRWALCADAGIFRLPVPREFGGAGEGALTTARAIEALGEGSGDTGFLFAIAAHLFACVVPVATFAGVGVRQELLDGLCSGAMVGGNAITEADAGSDVNSLQSTATASDGGYILNGRKSYVTNGPLADVFIVYASTEPKHGFLGISAFAVDRETAGLHTGEPFKKMGLANAYASELRLDGARVDAGRLLGVAGQGARIFRHSMLWERACLFAAYLGLMERQLALCVAHARTRLQFGRPIGSNQAISHRIADMRLRLESARLLLYRACWLLDEGQEAVLPVALAKLAASEAAIQNSLAAVQIHGAQGYDATAGIERMLRDSLPSAIFSGTSEMQRDLIAADMGL